MGAGAEVVEEEVGGAAVVGGAAAAGEAGVAAEAAAALLVAGDLGQLGVVLQGVPQGEEKVAL